MPETKALRLAVFLVTAAFGFLIYFFLVPGVKVASAQYGFFPLNVQSTPMTGIFISSNGVGVYDGVTNYTRNLSGSQINVDLIAPVVSGYIFNTWSGPCTTVNLSTRTCHFNNLNSAATVTAVYTPSVPITLDLKGNGSDGPLTVPSGTVVNMTWVSTGNPDFCFTSGAPWPNGGSKPNQSSGDPQAITVSGDYQLVCWRSSDQVSASDIVHIDVTVTNIDLKARFVAGSPQVYQVNQTANLSVKVTNIGTSASAATTLGLWPQGSGLPNCPGTPANPPAGQSYPVGALAPGQSVDVPVSFNVGPVANTYTAHAYVIPLCNQLDIYWPNNGTNDPGAVVEPGVICCGFTYVVSPPPAWFETMGSDVGSAAGITAQVPPATGRYNSAYLIAGADNGDPEIVSRIAKITGYVSPHRLIPVGGAYTYLADRFRSKAATPSCTLTGVSPNNLFYCASGVTIGATTISSGSNAFFIDGDLTITGNIVLAGASDTAAIIVRGNITVNSDVTRLDGIYVAGQTFSDVTAGSSVPVAAPQLLVNGAVWANQALLSRSLGGPTCGSICNNATDPAERLILDPKYFVLMNNILGSAAISWQEVAP